MSTQSFSASALLTLGLDESQMRGVLGPASLVSIPPGVTINNVSRLPSVHWGQHCPPFRSTNVEQDSPVELSVVTETVYVRAVQPAATSSQRLQRLGDWL